MNKMNPEWKAKWLAALRSDDFRQATTVLRGVKDIDGKPTCCCLGVICHLIDPSHWTTSSTVKSAYDYDYGWHGVLSPRVQELLGIPGPLVNALVSMNDFEGKSFLEIADWIEANL